jgi:hypothetical protein
MAVNAVVPGATPVWNQDSQEPAALEMIDYEQQFLEAARLHGHLMIEDPAATGEAYDKAAAALRALRTLPDQGNGFLLACLQDADPSVVSWAAAALLPNEEAVKALERVARGDNFVAFDAEMILDEWRAGRFKPD